MSSGNTRSGAGFCLNDVKTITVSVVGLSGTEDVKGAVGVGKSLLCNRFVRGDYDNFYPEHSSVLSQLDFCGSSVINNEHWLYWGEALINVPEANNRVQLRVIEQTEFVDDENFEPFGGYEDYAKRATKTKLESADKLMYICREQLGLETEFEQRSLAESRITVDAFIFVYDVSLVESRSYDNQSEYALRILLNISKAKCPVVIAATKADISDENGQRALQKLIARKELRSLNLQIIEVSSVTNVNVVTLFALVASLVEKWKMKPRVLSYVEAAKVQRKKECEISDLYVALLRQLTPVEFWPQSKPTWNKLLTRFGLSQHNEYKNFVYVFGTKKAKDRYKIYVEEAKNFWIRQRTHAQIIRLPEILQVFIGEEKLMSLTWVEAQRIIFDHSLFNNYFLPVGTLSSDLDPGSSQLGIDANESRIPADVLFSLEAALTFDKVKHIQQQKYNQTQMESHFKTVLANCTQVTPGKPLEEVDIFLRGDPNYDSMPHHIAQTIYLNYQKQLIEKARTEFHELLLEQVQLFIDYLCKRPKKQWNIKNYVHLDEIKIHLTDDARYRQLNCLLEDRERMLTEFMSFVAHPSTRGCYAGVKCIESILHENFHMYLESQQMLDSRAVFEMRVVPIGQQHLISSFKAAAEKVLCDNLFESERGLARVYFSTKGDPDNDVATDASWIFLVDSMESCEKLKRKLFEVSDSRCPSIIVLVADAVHFDMLPAVYKEACALARDCGATFVGPGSDPINEYNNSSENELNALFTRNQMIRIFDAVFLSQINTKRLDSRILISSLCGDELPMKNLLQSVLVHAVRFVPYAYGGAAVFDLNLPTLEQCVRVEISLSSYHSWFFARTSLYHGYIMVYCANRRASFAHMEAVLRNFVPLPNNTVILIVAFISAACSETKNEEVNELLLKGKELAEKLSASFAVFVDKSSLGSEVKSDEFVEFFERTVHVNLDSELTKRSSESSQLLYSNGCGMYCSKESNTFYGTDYTFSKWSNESKDSTSSSLKSGVILSPLYSDDLAKKFDNTHLSHETQLSCCANSVPTKNFPLSVLINDGLAPLATPEVTENFNDVISIATNCNCEKKSQNHDMFKRDNYSSEFVKEPSKEHRECLPKSNRAGRIVPLGRLKNRFQSVSAESLVTIGLGESNAFYKHSNGSEELSSVDTAKRSTTSYFVRKVASSFRFRKNGSHVHKKNSNPYYETDYLRTNLLTDQCSSEPHSPRGDRSLRSPPKTKEVSPYNEKSSSPFSWFPTRSPRHCTAKSLPCPVSSTAPTQPANTLKSLTANTEDLIPLFVKMCIKYIEEEGGFTTEGIYRIPGNQAQVSELENGFLSDSVNAFRLIKPPVNTAASALKNFFTNLSEPLIPCTTCEELLSCQDCDQMELLASRLSDKLKEWPLANQRTFVYLAAHLNRVAEHSAVNSMDTKNLAKIWWPTLFRPNFESFDSMALFVTRFELATQALLTCSASNNY